MNEKEGLIIGIGAPKEAMNELCVPAASLSVSDEGGAVAPAEGDMVDFNAAGKVSRVEGDKVYISIATVNGQEISKDEEKVAEESLEDKEVNEIKGLAKTEDEEMGY